MRRYSQAFLIVALFCFLFPFTTITPAPNSGSLPLTGWDQLSSQNISLSKQPPLILNIPLRLPVLLAVICGAAAVVAKLSRRSQATVIVAVATTAATVSLLTLLGSSPLVQVTDGQNVVHRFENPGVQLLPAFYVSVVVMCVAAVTSWMNLERQQNAAYNSKPAFVPPRAPAIGSAPSVSTIPAIAHNSFCIKCGDGLVAGARFCNRCGTPVAAPLFAHPPKSIEAAVVPKVEAANAAAVAQPAPLVVQQPPPTIIPVPPPPPPPVPAMAAMNVPAVVRAPQPRFSAGAKLGLAAASLVFATGIWLAFHPSADNSASMAAPTNISIYPASVRVAPGQTVQFQAVVTGGMNREVQWSVQEGTPGGSVESAGATVQNGTVFLVASYTAPLLPGIYHVMAVSAADQTRKAVTQVVVGYSFARPFSFSEPQRR